MHRNVAVRTAAVLAALAALTAFTSAAPPPSLLRECGPTDGVRAQTFWLRASDGERLYGMETGSGRAGLVLAHESPASLCGWLPYISTLSRAGLRVLAFDFRGYGASQLPKPAHALAYGRDLDAAISRIRADGARKVVVMGASFGGAAALNYGPELRVDGIVSLSGEVQLPAPHFNGLAAAPHLRAPLLVVGTRDDAYLPVADARKLLRRVGSRDKRLVLFPGGWHGWDIVEQAPYRVQARATLLAWIRAHTR